jgi:hypothetical protein
MNVCSVHYDEIIKHREARIALKSTSSKECLSLLEGVLFGFVLEAGGTIFTFICVMNGSYSSAVLEEEMEGIGSFHDIFKCYIQP